MNVNKLRYIKRGSSTANIQRYTTDPDMWVNPRPNPGCTFPSCDSECVFFSPTLQSQSPPAALHFRVRSPSLHLSQNGSGLLGEQEAEALLHRHAMAGELVVWGEASRVGRAGGLPGGTILLQRVDSVSGIVFVELEEHVDGFVFSELQKV